MNIHKGEFWREISWRIGDEHANRICWVVQWYCRLFRVDVKRLDERVPQ
jgi:hypothetical protein